MKVREVMTANIATAAPDTTLDEIAMLMRNENTGVVPIVEDDELVGVITDRDIVIRCVAKGDDPSDVEATEVLSEDVETIDPDTDVTEAMQLMADRQIRRLPVLEKGRLVGMVSIGDIATKQGDQERSGQTLKDISQGAKPTRAVPETARREMNTATRNATTEPGEGAAQGIGNRDLEDEEKRQERVISIRPDAESAPRGQRKPKREAS